MPRHIVFLRAINVGGRIVKMDRLRTLFSDMGFTGVETFIASGNVIFESRAGAAALEKRIQQQLERALGYAVVTFVRSPAEVARVARLEPFSKADLGAPGHSLYVAFLQGRPGPAARRALEGHASAVNAFAIDGREAFWLCRTKSAESNFSGAVLERVLGMPATLRNVTTVRKLAAKYGGAVAQLL